MEDFTPKFKPLNLANVHNIISAVFASGWDNRKLFGDMLDQIARNQMFASQGAVFYTDQWRSFSGGRQRKIDSISPWATYYDSPSDRWEHKAADNARYVAQLKEGQKQGLWSFYSYKNARATQPSLKTDSFFVINPEAWEDIVSNILISRTDLESDHWETYGYKDEEDPTWRNVWINTQRRSEHGMLLYGLFLRGTIEIKVVEKAGEPDKEACLYFRRKEERTDNYVLGLQILEELRTASTRNQSDRDREIIQDLIPGAHPAFFSRAMFGPEGENEFESDFERSEKKFLKALEDYRQYRQVKKAFEDIGGRKGICEKAGDLLGSTLATRVDLLDYFDNWDRSTTDFQRALGSMVRNVIDNGEFRVKKED